MTTKALQTVFAKAASLPEDLQERLARQWLEELEDEQRWDEKFTQTAATIDRLAQQALREHKQGKSMAKGIDEL